MQIEKTDVLYEGFERHLLLTVRLPAGETRTYQVDDHGSAACVLPYDEKRRVAALVLQLRAPLLFAGEFSPLLELPSGIIDTEDAETAARRETLEESGIELGSLELVASFWSMPGISTERLNLFLAPYSAADRVAPGGGLAHEGEDITVVELPLSELARMADGGELLDLKTFAAVQTLRLRAPALFR